MEIQPSPTTEERCHRAEREREKLRTFLHQLVDDLFVAQCLTSRTKRNHPLDLAVPDVPYWKSSISKLTQRWHASIVEGTPPHRCREDLHTLVEEIAAQPPAGASLPDFWASNEALFLQTPPDVIIAAEEEERYLTGDEIESVIENSIENQLKLAELREHMRALNYEGRQAVRLVLARAEGGHIKIKANEIPNGTDAFIDDLIAVLAAAETDEQYELAKRELEALLSYTH